VPSRLTAIILGILAGAAISMSGGFLLASYATAGIVPHHVVRAPAAPAPAFIDDAWPAPVYGRIEPD
jgi:hypothetical protein